MTTEPNRKPALSGKKYPFVLLAALMLAVLIAGILVILSDRSQPDAPDKNQPTFTVTPGPLTISVVEAGTIRPREQIILKSEVEGSAVILFLIAEGTEVHKGDLLVELDASQLMDQRVSQQIQVINAEATSVNASENLAVVKSQAQADIDQAELDLKFARQDLIQYREGEFPKLKKEAEAAITLAEETLTNATNTYDWSRKLFAEKYLSEAELKQDELSQQKARIDLELAKDELGLLENFTYTRKITELQSAASQAEMALERTKRKASADTVQAEAKSKASEAELKQQQNQFDRIENQISKTKIYAPMDGTVIYATSTKMSWRSNSEPLDEGQAVRERQELIYLPTTSSYNAEIKVHESSLEKIHSGLPVQISIDALPGRAFTGKVVSIAPLPDATSMFMNPDLKVYNTQIQIDGNGAELRNGMSCQAEIVIKRFAETLFVPLQAVLRVGGQPTVYLARGDGFQAQPVTTGPDNNRMIQILDGLTAGDQVLLTPPLAEAAKHEQAAPPGPDSANGAMVEKGHPPTGQKDAQKQRSNAQKPGLQENR